jgi:pyrroline-5-carboxylate reductase
VAQSLAVQTLVGTASLLDKTGQHPEELVDAVSSPGGTTIAAVEALEDGGFRSAVADAVSAAVERAKELGS